MTAYLLSAIFGLGVGFVGGYAGMGGAPFLIFLFTTVLGYSQHTAQGTAVAIMLGPMSLPGLLAMRSRIRPLLKYALIGVITYAGFSYLGANFSYFFSSRILGSLFAGLLILLGLRGLVASIRKPQAEQTGKPLIKLNALTIFLTGTILGTIGGFFGIGAGILLVPLLIWLFKMDKDDARTLSLMLLLPPVSIGAVIRYQQQGDIRWGVALICFAAYFVSNYWGARLGQKHAGRGFQGVLGAILLALGVVAFLL